VASAGLVASGDCAEKQWQFLSLEMPQWLLGIFVAYFVVAALVLIAQPFKPKNATSSVVNRTLLRERFLLPRNCFRKGDSVPLWRGFRRRTSCEQSTCRYQHNEFIHDRPH
jgi:hypothetical protein